MTENELNELINHSFLNASAHHIPSPLMENIAKHTLDASVASFSLTKVISITGLLSGTVLLVGWLLLSSVKTEHPTAATEAPSKLMLPAGTSSVAENSIEIKAVQISAKNTVKIHSAERNNQAPQNENSNLYLITESTAQTKELPEEQFVLVDHRPNHNSELYVFPVLTEKEIKYNEKQKKRLVRLGHKLEKGTYPKIHGNATLGEYYMMSAEVTNLSYRTFLFDLLLNNRKEEFLKAKPNQDLWLNAAGQSCFNGLAKTYFSDPKYNDYPVVNISVEGAEMYCRWLTEEVSKYALAEGNSEQRTFVLPTEQEWLYAAEAGRKNALYPWPLDSMQNRANCFMGNCCIQKLKDNIMKPICDNHHKIDESCYTSGGMMLRDSTIATVLVYSYNPSAYGLFTISGNVSELVYKNDGTGAKTKGGNWASDMEHLKLNSEDEFEGKLQASPMIGFRVMVRKR